MKRTRRSLLRALVVLACTAIFMTAPGRAATATVDAFILFGTFGSGGTLFYSFDTYHTGWIKKYNVAEGLLPATFQGTLLQNNGGRDYCNRSGLVKTANFICETSLVSACPNTSGLWAARTRMAIPVPVFGAVWQTVTGPVYANCPPPIEPPGCSAPYEATRLLAVDLDTGRVTRPRWPFETPQGLTRSETLGEKNYFREEWALMSTSGAGRTVTLAAASDAAQAQVDRYAESLVDTHGFDAGHRYLVVEAARHVGNRTPPLVRLASLESGRPIAGELSDGRVVFRAAFSSHGMLEDVETIEGSERTARRLAEDLRVEMPAIGEDEHDDHRSVVFAAFDVENGTPRFIAAVPTLPQCCCGPNYCY